MTYSDVIKVLENYNLLVDKDNVCLDFSYISYNSNDVIPNTLFICKGLEFKKEYLEDAISKGATLYISEIDFEVSIPKIIVSDSRKALALVSQVFYPDSLVKIGITGTKGKTTTNYFLHNILKNYLGYKPGFFATHYFYSGKHEGQTHLTTPESLELHRYLHEMDDANLKYMSMEVSSQAEYHNRVFGMNFDIGAFLNISEDHISPLEHKNFDEYLACKLKFLKKCSKVVLFRQTECFDRIYDVVSDKNVITFGYSNDCCYVIKNIVNNKNLSFELEYNGKTEIYEIDIPGRFNVTNACCAIVIAKLLGVNYESIQKGLYETFIPGRMNIIEDGICPVIIDYAHNELSARALYETLKLDYKDRNIKVVFGCPGDKGVNRRRDMGLLAGEYADYVYLTSEDPGHVNPNEICQDIAGYIKKYHSNYEIVIDREEAIRKALREASCNDIVVLLGKGDENYQIVGDKWLPYMTDIEVVKDELLKVKE